MFFAKRTLAAVAAVGINIASTATAQGDTRPPISWCSVDGCYQPIYFIASTPNATLTCNQQSSEIGLGQPCDSIKAFFTPQCSFEETAQNDGLVMCTVTSTECGCLYWEEGSDRVTPVWSKGSPGSAPPPCDACAVYGLDDPPATNGSVMIQVAVAFAVIAIGSFSALAV